MEWFWQPEFDAKDTHRLIELLTKYALPHTLQFDKEKVLDILKMDKKRDRKVIHFILLTKIGEAMIHPISIDALNELINQTH